MTILLPATCLFIYRTLWGGGGGNDESSSHSMTAQKQTDGSIIDSSTKNMFRVKDGETLRSNGKFSWPANDDDDDETGSSAISHVDKLSSLLNELKNALVNKNR
jgi:hypothetical protein